MDDAHYHHGHIRFYCVFGIRTDITEHIGMEALRTEDKAEDDVLLWKQY